MKKKSPIRSPRRSGRPLGFTRQGAVENAMNLFWKRGFCAVSAKDLAEAMAIERSSFYNSFGSREAVFEEALRAYTASAPDAPLGHLPPGRPVLPLLASVLREVCRVRAADTEARGCLVCNGVAELAGVEPTVGPLLEKSVGQRVSLLEDLFRRAVDQKEIPAIPDIAAAAGSFAAFLIGLNTLSKVVRDEAVLWAACRQFLRGLGAKDALLDSVAAPPTPGEARPKDPSAPRVAPGPSRRPK